MRSLHRNQSTLEAVIKLWVVCIFMQWIAWRVCSPVDTTYECTAYVSGALQYQKFFLSSYLSMRNVY